ncbi:MAG: hypothetical protein IJB69_01665 [Clostridia bacterium]|nr:hypothetical protein [Clostridia bacterium]
MENCFTTGTKKHKTAVGKWFSHRLFFVFPDAMASIWRQNAAVPVGNDPYVNSQKASGNCLLNQPKNIRSWVQGQCPWWGEGATPLIFPRSFILISPVFRP